MKITAPDLTALGSSTRSSPSRPAARTRIRRRCSRRSTRCCEAQLRGAVGAGAAGGLVRQPLREVPAHGPPGPGLRRGPRDPAHRRGRGRGDDGAGDRASPARSAGLDVLLRERSPEGGPPGLREIAETWTATSPSGAAPSRRRRRSWLASARSSISRPLEAAQLVIEAVPEDLELKAAHLRGARPRLPARGRAGHQHVHALGHRDRGAHEAARPRDRPALPRSRCRWCPWSRWCAASPPPTQTFRTALDFVRAAREDGGRGLRVPGLRHRRA